MQETSNLLSAARALAIMTSLAIHDSAASADAQFKTDTNPKMALWRPPAALKGADIAVTNKIVPTFEDFASLAATGANLVVLSANGIQRTVSPFDDDADAALRLANAVKGAERAGLWVVIAMRTGPGLEDVAVEAQTPGLQSKLWVDGAARHAFVKMWQRIANAFGNEQQVIGYDLIVEPLPEAAVEGLNTCCASISDTALRRRGIDWPAIADTIAAAIRQVDTLTPVLVGATGFALPPFFAKLRPIHDQYVVYDVHQYEPHTYTQQGNPGIPTGLAWPGGRFTYWRDRTEDTLNEAWLRRVVAPVVAFQRRAGGPPIIVGEFGVNRQAPGAPSFIASETVLFDSLGWHGAMWIWRCCGSLAVSASDSLAADPQRRLIFKSYRDYWKRRSSTNAPGSN